jgi:hypothetical protein
VERVKPLDADEIRASFVNLAAEDAARVPLPPLHDVIWAEREYLGWRDPGAPQRGYLVHVLDGGAVGLVLRASPAAPPPGVAAMCSLCRSARPSDRVTMFSAPRAGRAGQDGNTVGTYICDDLECSHVLRQLPPATATRSPAQLLAERTEGLTARLAAFTANVMRVD